MILLIEHIDAAQVGLVIRSEAKAHGTHILRNNPNARVAMLYQNDDYGKDYVEGLRERLGAQTHEEIVALASYEITDPNIDFSLVCLFFFLKKELFV